MANLSPAAASIVRAFDDRYEISMFNENWQEDCIAAALRAAAAATQSRQYNDCYICGFTDLLAIADELEAQ